LAIEVVELKGVGPSGIVGVSAERGDGAVRQPRPAVWRVSKISLGSLEEKIRTLCGESVVESDVVRHKIKEKLHASLFKAFAEARELGITTK
jgi:hypothetical protein